MEDYLYGKDTRAVTYAEFINKELVLFSNMDNERSIPSLVDGLKPGQRKVLFTCFKRADKKEVKVAQLAGAVGEMSAYHHGEVRLVVQRPFRLSGRLAIPDDDHRELGAGLRRFQQHQPASTHRTVRYASSGRQGLR